MLNPTFNSTWVKPRMNLKLSGFKKPKEPYPWKRKLIIFACSLVFGVWFSRSIGMPYVFYIGGALTVQASDYVVWLSTEDGNWPWE